MYMQIRVAKKGVGKVLLYTYCSFEYLHVI